MTATEWGLLVLLGAIWGASFYFAAIILEHCPLLILMWGRVTVGAALLALIARLQGHAFPSDRATWRDLAVMGLLNNIIPFGLIFWGQGHIGAGLAALLNSTTPLFSAILGHWVTRTEPLTAPRVIGIVLGMLGVACIAGPDAVAGNIMEVLGAIAVIVGSASYAVAGIWGQRLRDLPPTITSIGQLGSTSLVLLPVMLVFTPPWYLPPLPAHVWQAFAGLGVLCTCVAYILYFHLLRTAGPTNTLLVTLLIPAFALLLAVTLLNERFTAVQGAGMGLIGVGLGVIAIAARRPQAAIPTA